MIAAPSGIQGSLVLDAFVRMAQGMNMVHEFNPRLGTFAHGDGWGCSLISDGRLIRYNSVLPCWEDPLLDTFRDKTLVALHARRATCGRSDDARNSHPFVAEVFGESWHFMHNGTVRDALPVSIEPTGDTDSERYFLYLLDSIRAHGSSVQGIESAVQSIEAYTCLNAFLYSRSEMYVIARAASPLTYYKLHHAKESRKDIYSSEPLLEISHAWAPFGNQVLRHSLRVPSIGTSINKQSDRTHQKEA